ncbi:MAG: class D beta-lactamase [Chitinophagaceae bacterium]|nr:MAG: beta-lactamase [Bacteroidetes bacterium OLB11]MCC6448455.1 class D beta-lactamase [Chitinophagaceae bacterium]HMN33443.1 penicillin-binding transpeptidase domain-containing protein [Chitinophagaceae bacterium]
MKHYVWLLFFIIPFSFYSCENNHISYENQWGDVFKKYGIDSACFELVDNNHDIVHVYNLERASKRFSPASTFKIMNSLIALETSTAPDEKFIIKWDGQQRNAEWDKDMDMREAFNVSNVYYFQELAKKIGKISMQKYLDTIRYGNKNIGNSIEQFWLNDSLKITADEQVGFIKKLYFDKLPMSQRTQRIVRSMLLKEDEQGYKLYYKTGTKEVIENNQKHLMAWLVGYAERKETQKTIMEGKEETNYKPYFFAMNFDSNESIEKTSEIRLSILKEILKQQRILP